MEYFYMPVKHQVYIFVNAFVAVIQSRSCVQFFLIPHQALLSFTVSQTLLRLLSIESVMLSDLSSCHPLLLPSIFPASRSFPMSQLFASGGQSIGASASVLPMNIQCWFPIGLTILVHLLSKGLSEPTGIPTIALEDSISKVHQGTGWGPEQRIPSWQAPEGSVASG